MLTHEIQQSAEYNLIQNYYRDQTAQRTGIPLINHIREGIHILDILRASQDAMKAFCLHPIFQADTALVQNYGNDYEHLSTKAIILTMEYRSIANSYLSARTIHSVAEIRLSPLTEVNQMLIADKVQNRKDFELHHLSTHPHSQELARYFANWLQRLGVTEAQYQHLCARIS